MYGLLFQPMRIGALELKNRLVMPAMNSHLADGEHHFTDQALNYYGERALGGFGLQITEFLCVSEEGLAYACLLYTSPSPRDERQNRMPSSA